MIAGRAWRTALFALAFAGCTYPSQFVLVDSGPTTDASADAQGNDALSDVRTMDTHAGDTGMDAVGVDNIAADAHTPDATDGTVDVVVCDATVCGGACVDVQSDPNNCGACGSVCAPNQTGNPACSNGHCVNGCANGFRVIGTACDVPPPRLIAPLGFVTTTATTPLFTWANASAVPSATIEVSGTSDFRVLAIAPQPVTGTQWMPPASVALSRGRWFWRARGVVGGVVGSTTSVVRWFIVQTGSANPAGTSSFGVDCDFNNDGNADFVIGAASSTGDVLWGLGGTQWPATPSAVQSLGFNSAGLGAADWGRSVACIGDVNGDGFGDIAIGAPGIGLASVYSGASGGLNTNGPMWTTAQAGINATSGQMGWSVAAAGDVNGDGYADLIIGAAVDPTGTSTTWPDGDAIVVFGSSTGPSASTHIAHAAMTGGDYGAAVAGVGDVDGDGFWDVAVGGPHVGGSVGALAVYRGGAGSTIGAEQWCYDGFIMPGSHGMVTTFLQVGAAIATAGDYDGDGLADVVIGSLNAPMGGVSFVSPAHSTVGACGSGANSVGEDGEVSLTGATGLGASVAFAGDIDHDGLSESLVGEPGNNRAFLFHPGRAPSTYTYVMGAFGTAVASGDLNGDGVRDFLFGVPTGGPGSGCVMVYVPTIGDAAGASVALQSSAQTVLVCEPSAFPDAGNMGPDTQFGRSLARASWSLPIVAALGLP